MHVRYAHNTREQPWRDRAREGKLPLPCLPCCCAPGRPGISSAPSLRDGPPAHPCEPLGIAGAVTLQPYASRLVIFSRVTRGSVALHALISRGVMTTAGPVQAWPAPLERRCLPPFSRRPSSKAYSTIWLPTIAARLGAI